MSWEDEEPQPPFTAIIPGSRDATNCVVAAHNLEMFLLTFLTLTEATTTETIVAKTTENHRDRYASDNIIEATYWIKCVLDVVGTGR